MIQQSTEDDLSDLREKIDILDEQIVRKIARRTKIAKKIGVIKKHQKIQILDQERWSQVLQNLSKHSKEYQIDTNTIHQIWEIIHKYTISEEEKAND